MSGLPRDESQDRVVAIPSLALGVDGPAFLEVDAPVGVATPQLDATSLATHLQNVEDVRQADFRQISGEIGGGGGPEALRAVDLRCEMSDLCDQICRVEWLRQEFVRPELHRFEPVLDLAVGGEYDERDVGYSGIAAHPAEQLEAVHRGHGEVAQYYIGYGHFHEADGIGAVRALKRLVPLGVEQRTYHGGDQLLVIDNQYACRHLSLPCP